MLLILGISFLVPVILVGVNMAGVVRGKTILKAWRIIVFLVFVLAALAAPGTDALSMFLLAAPLLVLFFAAIALCIFNDKRRDKRLAKRAAETDATADIATPGSELKNL
jgi:sec-independent protein translocase protein TatC